MVGKGGGDGSARPRARRGRGARAWDGARGPCVYGLRACVRRAMGRRRSAPRGACRGTRAHGCCALALAELPLTLAPARPQQDWQPMVKTWLNQAARKSRRRNGASAPAAARAAGGTRVRTPLPHLLPRVRAARARRVRYAATRRDKPRQDGPGIARRDDSQRRAAVRRGVDAAAPAGSRARARMRASVIGGDAAERAARPPFGCAVVRAVEPCPPEQWR